MAEKKATKRPAEDLLPKPDPPAIREDEAIPQPAASTTPEGEATPQPAAPAPCVEGPFLPKSEYIVTAMLSVVTAYLENAGDCILVKKIGPPSNRVIRPALKELANGFSRSAEETEVIILLMTCLAGLCADALVAATAGHDGQSISKTLSDVILALDKTGDCVVNPLRKFWGGFRNRVDKHEREFMQKILDRSVSKALPVYY